eukprot:6452647-Karenia_brevis.AAC.1
MAMHMHQLILHIIACEKVPLNFRGGRIVDVWKNKGDQELCENSRGLLISNHVAQVLTTLLKDNLNKYYEHFVGDVQCGCVSKRGCDIANHIVRSFIDCAALLGNCLFVLFLDLVKAFDLVIREILM